MNAAGGAPIRDSMGAALRFVREQWGFVLSASALAAGAHGVALAVLGSSSLWLIAVALVSAAAYATLTRAALSGLANIAPGLWRDTARVAASVTIVGLLLGLVAFVIAYVAMAVLIAPFAEEATAAQANEAAMAALLERAVSAQPGVVFWAALIGAVIIFLLSTRLFLAAPASVDRGRIVVFDSWRMTRGNLLRIAAARVALLAPALVLVGALQSLVGLATGIGADNPIAMAARAQGNSLGFIVFYTGAQFLQIAIYASLEAGLSVAFYRALRPPAA